MGASRAQFFFVLVAMVGTSRSYGMFDYTDLEDPFGILWNTRSEYLERESCKNVEPGRSFESILKCQIIKHRKFVGIRLILLSELESREMVVLIEFLNQTEV